MRAEIRTSNGYCKNAPTTRAAIARTKTRRFPNEYRPCCDRGPYPCACVHVLAMAPTREAYHARIHCGRRRSPVARSAQIMAAPVNLAFLVLIRCVRLAQDSQAWRIESGWATYEEAAAREAALDVDVRTTNEKIAAGNAAEYQVVARSALPATPRPRRTMPTLESDRGAAMRARLTEIGKTARTT